MGRRAQVAILCVSDKGEFKRHRWRPWPVGPIFCIRCGHKRSEFKAAAVVAQEAE